MVITDEDDKQQKGGGIHWLFFINIEQYKIIPTK